MFCLSFTLGVHSSLLAGLMPDVQFYCQCTFSANTFKTYGFYFWAYNRFCVLLGIGLMPALTSTLCMYSVFLARFLLQQSVCLCVNFVKRGLLNLLVNNWRTSSVVKGIRRVHGTTVKPRLPITKEFSLGI